MAQHYHNPARADDPHALPDLETFYVSQEEANDNAPSSDDDDEGGPTEPGWYYWHCLPGCMPDGDCMGPFETEEEALEDARSDLE